MKKFTKGMLVTYVDDNDRRIPEYIKNGWKEAAIEKKQMSEADERMTKAIDDVVKSRPKKKKTAPADEEVNAAVKANETAAAESQAVDDGLIKRGE